MSQRSEYACDGDGCTRTAAADGFYVLPAGWTIHHSQATPGKALHACGPDCAVKLLRADATALEELERARRAEAAAHARSVEEAHQRGLARHEAAQKDAARRREEGPR